MWGRTLACLSVLPWPLASAAPWVEQEGWIYSRSSLSYEQLNQVAGWRGDIYFEYGMSEDWTVTGKLETVAYPQNPIEDGDGVRVTVRRALFRSDQLSVTAEFGALQGSAIGGFNGCDAPGLELRGGAARTQKVFGRDTYMFGELVRREHEACRRDRLELGAGARLTHRIWASSQIWLERRNPVAASDKVQFELLWRQQRVDYALGYRRELSGDFSEQGVFVAIARRF